MTRRAFRLVRALVLCAAAAGPWAAALADPAAPYVVIRQLQRLQEQVARGSRAAQSAQGQLMEAIPATFLAADPALWREPRNARAAVMYLFSGGRPTVIRTVLNRSTMPRDIDPLLKGALAYAEGHDGIALDLLKPIDPKSLPEGLGGHLALVEATLLAQKDPARARKLLDTARLLVPGTLVEEAALRRQIFLDSDPALLGTFVFLSRQYLHRFHASIYAENFKQHLGEKAVEIGASGDMPALGMMDAVVSELPPPESRALYLAMARAAVVQGHTEAARFSAQRAAAIAKDSSHDSVRAQLYASAALIVSDDVGKGIAALEAADRSRLSPGDADLRDAALAVAQAVTRPVPDAAGASGGSASGDALADEARAALATGDRLLEDGAP